MNKVWMFRLPGGYPAQIPEPVESEAEARAWIRKYLGNVKRVPNHTEVYQNDASWASDMARHNQAAGFNASTGF